MFHFYEPACTNRLKWLPNWRVFSSIAMKPLHTSFLSLEVKAEIHLKIFTLVYFTKLSCVKGYCFPAMLPGMGLVVWSPTKTDVSRQMSLNQFSSWGSSCEGKTYNRPCPFNADISELWAWMEKGPLSQIFWMHPCCFHVWNCNKSLRKARNIRRRHVINSCIQCWIMALGGPRPKIFRWAPLHIQGGPKKVSHYHWSSLNRIKTRNYG